MLLLVHNHRGVAVKDSETTQGQTHNGALDSPLLDQLLCSYGIASEFIEFSGNIAHITTANRLHMLACMGAQPHSAAEVDAMLAARQRELRDGLLPPVYVLPPGTATPQLNLHPAEIALPVVWRLSLEDGSVREGSSLPTQLPVNGDTHLLPLTDLPCGYHQLQVQQGSSQSNTLLVVAPTECYRPQALINGKRWWGVAVQLYSVRSDDNWGMGDFADLLYLVEQAGSRGAAFALLNPLHYLDLRYPDNASPYSPSDRRFLNPLYIAAELCEDFMAPAVQAVLAAQASQDTLIQLRAAANVDYTGVANFKLPILALMYEQFQAGASKARLKQFIQFCTEGGAALQGFAAMQATLGIRSESVFAQADFHLYLQWLASQQLAACQQLALQAGMELGLVRDLAVGSSGDGCEVVGNPGLFCLDARVGAPPDNFNPLGQNWGLPPMSPAALVEQRFAHFIRLLQSNMQSCGALRIDHVMSMMRLWWCPNDGSNAEGAYVHYPVDVMFAILRLESLRNRCVVIGEDLGVVPPEISRFLDPAGIYSNCVFYFEKYDGWHFRKPEHYKPQALAMIANHDVPPLLSWWNRTDLPLRRSLNLIPDDTKLQHEMEHRQGEKGMLLQWLDELGLLPDSWHDRNTERPLDTVLTAALVRACGRTASALVSLQLDDIAGSDTPVNIPGTSNEYPNWRRKLPGTLNELFAQPAGQSLLTALAQERPR